VKTHTGKRGATRCTAQRAEHTHKPQTDVSRSGAVGTPDQPGWGPSSWSLHKVSVPCLTELTEYRTMLCAEDLNIRWWHGRCAVSLRSAEIEERKGQAFFCTFPINPQAKRAATFIGSSTDIQRKCCHLARSYQSALCSQLSLGQSDLREAIKSDNTYANLVRHAGASIFLVERLYASSGVIQPI
jgi:hypothetical protein